MADMALYARADGLLEPRATKSIEFVKQNAGKLLIADISANIRTSLQNRYLNGWIYTKQICDKLNAAGIMNPVGAMWTRNTIHAVMQDSFLLKEEFLHNGRHVKIYESTADMSRARFTNYIKEQITPFVYSLWEIHIEDPKEGYWREILNEINSKLQRDQSK